MGNEMETSDENDCQERLVLNLAKERILARLSFVCGRIEMKYYAKYSFTHNAEHQKDYVLKEFQGSEPKNFEMAVYKRGSSLGKKYIRMDVPRSPAMKRHFAYTFEMSYNIPFTSTEKLNSKNQTFGDSKKLGSSDLILFQFDDQLENLDVYFLKNAARNVAEKKYNFDEWVNGERLEAEWA